MKRFLGAVYVLLVLVGTLQPQPVTETEALVRCIICGRRGMADALLNIVLFVPFGVLFAARWRALRTILAAAVLSGAIEAAQLVIPGRDASAGDILFNTLGAAIGVLMIHYAGVWLAERYRRPIAVGYAALLIGVFFMTGWLLRPRTPPGPYSAQLAPELAGYDTFPGVVRAAALAGQPVRAGPTRGSEAWPTVIGLGAPLGASIVTGPPTEDVAPLVELTDREGHEVALLAVDGSDVVYRRWNYARRLLFDAPSPRMYAGLDTLPAGTPLLVTAQTARGGTCFAIDRIGTCGFGFDVGDGWRLLREIPTTNARTAAAIGALWLVLLTLPLGYFAGFRVGFGLFLVLAWYAWIRGPLDTALLSISISDTLALALGIAIGAGAARMEARRHAASMNVNVDNP